MEYPFTIDENGKQGIICADKNYFSEKAVLLVAEQYSKKFFVSVFPEGEKTVKFTIIAKDDEFITEKFLREMMNNLIDYQIKLELELEFGDIKRKIVDYAFSSVV